MDANMNNGHAGKNVLGPDVEIKGNLKFSGELTFEGKLDGEIQTDGVLSLGDAAVAGHRGRRDLRWQNGGQSEQGGAHRSARPCH
jgi:hypothetical protein